MHTTHQQQRRRGFTGAIHSYDRALYTIFLLLLLRASRRKLMLRASDFSFMLARVRAVGETIFRKTSPELQLFLTYQTHRSSSRIAANSTLWSSHPVCPPISKWIYWV